jgi:hypothetical protein
MHVGVGASFAVGFFRIILEIPKQRRMPSVIKIIKLPTLFIGIKKKKPQTCRFLVIGGFYVFAPKKSEHGSHGHTSGAKYFTPH